MNVTQKIATSAVAFALVASVTAAADVDFEKEIKPIIEKTCLKCHGPEKPKGGLRLDTFEGLTKGAKSGKVVVAGNADESRLYEVLTLEKDDPDHMPAEGEPLNKLEQELIRDWINQGLKWPDKLVLTPPAGSGSSVPEIKVDPGVPISDAEKAAVEKVKKLNALAMRLAQNTNLLRVDFSLQGKESKDADLESLKDMANLVELNLGNTQITDAGLVHVKPLVNLTRLQLHKTKITDAGLENLKGLEKLTSLNLYGTEVTDAGLEHLKDLKGLKKLYVWQSKVTPDGAKKLQEAIPGLMIELGYDAKPPETPKAEEKKDEPKEEKKDEKKEEKKEEKKDEKKEEKKQ
jgi:Planctomycete cytochrome C/Leucine Rich repeat